MPGGHVTVGLWLESWMQPAWRARALRLLRERANVELTYVAIAPPAPHARPTVNRRLGGLLGRLLARDHRRALRFSPDPFALEDVRPLLAGVPIGSDRIAPPAFDVAVQLGGAAPPADLAAARFGLWRFDSDPTHLLDGLPLGFWDVLQGRETVATTLRVQRGPGVPGSVIHARVGATAVGSVALTAMHALWRQAGDLAIKLGQLAVLGPDVLTPLLQPAGAATLAVPGTLRTIALWAKHTARVAGRRVSLFGGRHQWHLLAAASGPDPRGEFDLRRYRPILPPPDRFWADPFPVVHEGRTFVFVEEQLFSEPFAHISVIELRPDGTASPARVVLTRPYHLSYPFVLRWNEQWYLLPESSAGGRLELLRAVSFPYEWETDRVLLNEAVADATIAPIDGQWWMFAAKTPAPGLDCDDLYLYRAPSPLGPWTPHPKNPVRSDVSNSRPAGRLVFHDGAWWWPVQDGSKRYGYAVRWHRILRLDDEGLEEGPGPVVLPVARRGLLAVHTMNTADGISLLDGLHVISRAQRE